MHNFNAPPTPGQNALPPRPAASLDAPSLPPETAAAALPAGWFEVETLPDGALRLRPVKTGKAWQCALWLAVAWLFFGFALHSAAHPHSYKDTLDAPYIYFMAVVSGIPWSLFFLWEGWGREEWLVGPNRLELRRQPGFLRWGGKYKTPP